MSWECNGSEWECSPWVTRVLSSEGQVLGLCWTGDAALTEAGPEQSRWRRREGGKGLIQHVSRSTEPQNQLKAESKHRKGPGQPSLCVVFYVCTCILYVLMVTD